MHPLYGPPTEKTPEKTPEESAAPLVTIAQRLTETHHDELPALIEQMKTQIGPDRLRTALEDLTARGTKYRFPSNLRNAIRATTATLAPTDKTATTAPADSRHPAIAASEQAPARPAATATAGSTPQTE